MVLISSLRDAVGQTSQFFWVLLLLLGFFVVSLLYKTPVAEEV